MKKILLFFLASLCAILAMFLKLSNKAPIPVQLTELRTNMMRDITTFDPRIATDSESMQIGVMLFSGLTYADDQGNITLDLAESYTLSDDQKTYRFVLKDLLWSDGSPLTAFDCEESWKEYAREDFPASLWEMVSMIKNSRGQTDKNPVQGIRALDAKTVEIELTQPTCYFLELLAHTTLFPVHHSMRGKFLQNKKIDPTAIVCSGPFKIKHFAEGDEILFEKNPHYHKASSVSVDRIHMSRIADAQTALVLFEKQELDWLGLPLSELPVDALPDLKKRGLLRSYPLLDARFLYFNTKEFPFNNTKLRRALSLAIDRKAIIENVLQTPDLVALDYLPVGQKREHPHFQDADEKTARTLFKEALEEMHLRVEEFPEISLSYNTSDMWRRVMEAIQEQWRKVLGITVRLENTEWKVHLERMQRGNFKIARGGRFADFFDPLAFLKPMLSYNLTQNYCRWENAEYDALVTSAMKAVSNAERNALLERAEGLMMEEMPIAPLYHGASYSICRSDLKGIAVSPLYHVDFSKAYFEKADK